MKLAKVIRHEGNQVTLEFEEDISPEYLKLIARGKENYAMVDWLDEDPKTLKQNALAHALINDIADWYGDYPKVFEREVLKKVYQDKEYTDFSHGDASKSEMARWIDFLIEFIISHGVELPKRYSYLLENDRFFYYACKYRKCCVCGASNAQIHHVNAVGNRHRNQVDHRIFPFASLCWKHHNVAHNLGQIVFLERYKVTPVLLDKEALIKIGIMSNAQIMRFDEQYQDEELFLKAIG